MASGDGQFNCIAIFDAIPSGELNTARRLRDDLTDISSYVFTDLQVRYFRICTLDQLKISVSNLVQEAQISRLKPWLHLEDHGVDDETGFVTADSSCCTWKAFKDLIVPLNLATNLNLVLVLATCFGGSFARAITTTDRAPVLGLIGPNKSVSAGQLGTDFPSFYKTFFQTGSLKNAISALTAGGQMDLYYRTTAEKFFYDVWAGYKKNACSEDKLSQRAERMHDQLHASGFPNVTTVEELKHRLKTEERGLFEKYRDNYFMYDVDDANHDRFPVTYEEAEMRASE